MVGYKKSETPSCPNFPKNFDISKAEVSYSASGSLLTLTIFSNYFSNIGTLGTATGALFLRTSNPGSAVAGSDGSSWNYGVRANDVNSSVAVGAACNVSGILESEEGSGSQL